MKELIEADTQHELYAAVKDVFDKGPFRLITSIPGDTYHHWRGRDVTGKQIDVHLQPFELTLTMVYPGKNHKTKCIPLKDEVRILRVLLVAAGIRHHEGKITHDLGGTL